MISGPPEKDHSPGLRQRILLLKTSSRKFNILVVHKNNSMATQTDIDTYLKILVKVIESRKQ
jgi:hypothetical protein